MVCLRSLSGPGLFELAALVSQGWPRGRHLHNLPLGRKSPFPVVRVQESRHLSDGNLDCPKSRLGANLIGQRAASQKRSAPCFVQTPTASGFVTAMYRENADFQSVGRSSAQEERVHPSRLRASVGILVFPGRENEPSLQQRTPPPKQR